MLLYTWKTSVLHLSSDSAIILQPHLFILMCLDWSFSVSSITGFIGQKCREFLISIRRVSHLQPLHLIIGYLGIFTVLYGPVVTAATLHWKASSRTSFLRFRISVYTIYVITVTILILLVLFLDEAIFCDAQKVQPILPENLCFLFFAEKVHTSHQLARRLLSKREGVVCAQRNLSTAERLQCYVYGNDNDRALVI